MSPDTFHGKTIVVTGVTGQVARPLALALARDNRVVGAARFSDTAARAELEAAGVECVPIDLVAGDVGGLPADADYVLNFAVAKTNDWDRDLAANSGGLAYLMEHHRDGRCVPALFVDRGLQAGRSPGPRRVGAARRQPRRVALPADLQHLQDRRRGNGALGGRAVRLPDHDRPALRSLRGQRRMAGHPPAHDVVGQRHSRPRRRARASTTRLHADDIFAMVPRLLAAASVPAVTVNWGGSEPVSIEEWCTYLGELTGVDGTLRSDRTDHRQRADRHDAHARGGGPHDGALARRHAAHGAGAASGQGGVSGIRFERWDPEEPPASELLAEMRAELNDVYETFNRLDNPPLSPDELRGRRAGRTSSATTGAQRRPAVVCADSTTAWRRSSGCSSAPLRDRAGVARAFLAALETDGAGARLRTGPSGHRTEAGRMGSRSTAPPGTWTSRRTTTTRSPVSGEKRSCERGPGVRGRGADRN